MSSMRHFGCFLVGACLPLAWGGNADAQFARGKLLATATVRADRATPTSTGLVLLRGRQYIVVGSKVASLWAGQDDGVDSVFRYKTPLEPGGGPLKVWGQLKLISPDVHLSDLIKKQTGKDPVYNPAHEYQATVTGDGRVLGAIVYDAGSYSDNRGSLQLDVYEAIPQAAPPLPPVLPPVRTPAAKPPAAYPDKKAVYARIRRMEERIYQAWHRRERELYSFDQTGVQRHKQEAARAQDEIERLQRERLLVIRAYYLRFARVLAGFADGRAA